jgi:PAS domain S-box-containing protein
VHERVIEQARGMETRDGAVIATDPAGFVIYWGRGAEQLYGWTEADAMGRNILDLTPTELSRAEAEGIMRTLANGRPWSGEIVVHAKDGNRFTVEVFDVPVHDLDGTLLGIIGTSRRTKYIAS